MIARAVLIFIFQKAALESILLFSPSESLFLTACLLIFPTLNRLGAPHSSANYNLEGGGDRAWMNLADSALFCLIRQLSSKTSGLSR